MKAPHLAAVLRTKMAEMKAIGPHTMAAFNDDLRGRHEHSAPALHPGEDLMPAGRPSKYDPDYHPEHAYKLALLSPHR